MVLPLLEDSMESKAIVAETAYSSTYILLPKSFKSPLTHTMWEAEGLRLDFPCSFQTILRNIFLTLYIEFFVLDTNFYRCLRNLTFWSQVFHCGPGTHWLIRLTQAGQEAPRPHCYSLIALFWAGSWLALTSQRPTCWHSGYVSHHTRCPAPSGLFFLPSFSFLSRDRFCYQSLLAF